MLIIFYIRGVARVQKNSLHDDSELLCLIAPTYLIQTMVETDAYKTDCTIKFLRRFSSKINSSDCIESFSGLLDGIILTVPQEIPSINILALDIPKEINETDITLLQSWLQGNVEYLQSTTKSLALRSGVLWQRAWDVISSSGDKKTIVPYSTVILSGGAGGIGSILSEHLVEKYKCKVICLTHKTSHSKLNDSNVRYVRCDITDVNAVNTVFSELQQSGTSVSAIYHLAGKAAKNIFIRKDCEIIQRALKPKLNGAINLLDIATRYSIPNVILFSSASAVLGGIGELEYCAANYALDLLAQEANSSNLRVISINWGAWDYVGMRHQHKTNFSINNNHEVLTINESLSLFDQCLNVSISNVAAIPFKFSELRRIYESNFKEVLRKQSLSIDKPIKKRPRASYDYQGPVTELEKKICVIWGNHLGINEVGVDDNFFDLGGNSLMALGMKHEIEEVIQCELNLESLVRCQTVSALLRHYKKPVSTKLDPLLVQLSTSKSVDNIFCVHAVMGTVFPFIDLAKTFEDKVNFFAIQDPQLIDENDKITSIQEIAQRYIKSIKTVQASGPYVIAGWSFGGLVAYEIAKQLQAKNEKISHLFIIDMAIQSEANPHFNVSEEEIKDRFLTDLYSIFDAGTQLDDKDIQPLLAVFQNNVHAARNYFNLNNNIPSKLNANCTLISAKEGIKKSSEDSQLGWLSHIDTFETISVSGDHYSILKSPTVNKISTIFLEKIKRGTE